MITLELFTTAALNATKSHLTKHFLWMVTRLSLCSCCIAMSVYSCISFTCSTGEISFITTNRTGIEEAQRKASPLSAHGVQIPLMPFCL